MTHISIEKNVSTRISKKPLNVLSSCHQPYNNDNISNKYDIKYSSRRVGIVDLCNSIRNRSSTRGKLENNKVLTQIMTTIEEDDKATEEKISKRL